MSLSLFGANLKASRGGLIAWGVIALLLALAMVSLYPSGRETFGTEGFLRDYLESLPEQIRIIYGTEELSRLFSPEGILAFESFLSLEYMTWWPVILSIFAIFFAGGSIAREVERGTMDLLLSQPIARSRVVISKYASFLVALLSITIASLIGVFFGVALNSIDAKAANILIAFLQGALLVAAVGGYSLWFSTLFFDPRRALTFSGLLTAVFYIINPLAASFESVRWARNLSLFYHFDAQKTMGQGQLDWTSFAIFLSIAVLGFAAALITFQRKDLLV